MDYMVEPLRERESELESEKLCVGKMARKCRKLIYVQGSQKIRDSEDGLASEGCQKGSY